MLKLNTKVRYSVKYTNGNIEHKIYTLDQVEKEGLSKLFDTTNCEIIGRSLSTNIINKYGEEIFENDVVKNSVNEIGSIKFIDGTFWFMYYYEPCQQHISDFTDYDISTDKHINNLKIVDKIALLTR